MKAPRMNKVAAAAAAVTGMLTMPVPALGAVLFSDNFDTDSAITVLDFNSFNNWTVSDGTVDYIRNGAFGISCFGGTGGCVDLDGSSGDAGRMLSKTIFSFAAGVSYTLTAEVSGNQRHMPGDTFIFGIDGVVSFPFTNIAPTDPFAARTITFSFASPVTGRLFVQDGNATGDLFGPILDNVSLSDNRTLPEPGTLGLLGLTLAGLLLGRRDHAM